MEKSTIKLNQIKKDLEKTPDPIPPKNKPEKDKDFRRGLFDIEKWNN